MQPNAIPNITKKRDLQHYPTLPNATPTATQYRFYDFLAKYFKTENCQKWLNLMIFRKSQWGFTITFGHKMCIYSCHKRYLEHWIVGNWPVMYYDHRKHQDVSYILRHLIDESLYLCFTCLINGCNTEKINLSKLVNRLFNQTSFGLSN